MSEFEREERYIVIKLKDQEEGNSACKIKDFLRSQGIAICVNDCVVVESDWPMYGQVWDDVQRWVEGRPQRVEELGAERDALATQRDLLNEKLKDIKDALYGRGLEIAGWHMSGNLEPMDSWFEENDWEPITEKQAEAGHEH